MVQEALFICGSLSSGMVHHTRIENFVESECEAVAKGTVYRLEVGYPVFLAKGETPIQGSLTQFQNSETLLRILDEFHGYSIKTPEKSLYIRAEIKVQTGATVLSCQTYVMNPVKLPKTATLIADGDWRRSLREKEPLTQRLTANQVRYIQKLGQSSGRDIVPINLDLYRELMNKGLIVDKGRRLALTKLGQEVFRFIE